MADKEFDRTCKNLGALAMYLVLVNKAVPGFFFEEELKNLHLRVFKKELVENWWFLGGYSTFLNKNWGPELHFRISSLIFENRGYEP